MLTRHQFSRKRCQLILINFSKRFQELRTKYFNSCNTITMFFKKQQNSLFLVLIWFEPYSNQCLTVHHNCEDIRALLQF